MPTQTIGQVSWHFNDQGRGEALVLLHGFPLDQSVWRQQLAALSIQHRVITPDLPGFGQSKPGSPFTMSSMADSLHEFLKKIGALPCTLAGLSMGGYVALAFWKKYAADLRALILTDTRAASDAPEGRTARNTMIELARTGGSSAVAAQMMPKMTAASAPGSVVQELDQIMKACPAETIQHALAAMRDREDFSNQLDQIKIPTLIIVGAEDQLTVPAMSESMQRGIPQSQLLIVPSAGHMTPMEKPEQVTTAIASFLANLSKPS